MKKIILITIILLAQNAHADFCQEAINFFRNPPSLPQISETMRRTSSCWNSGFCPDGQETTGAAFFEYLLDYNSEEFEILVERLRLGWSQDEFVAGGATGMGLISFPELVDELNILATNFARRLSEDPGTGECQNGAPERIEFMFQIWRHTNSMRFETTSY